ncbi:MAG: phage Gp37/Gp68 family protein [Rhodospirillales bacterium]|nr:phage Gp37/Gp68 family protein [Rhodospirillales bacterium]
MSDRTAIEWADATWNPVTGCSPASTGCRHCYAARLAGTLMAGCPTRRGLTYKTQAGRFVFNGELRFNWSLLTQPMRWQRPRTVFVGAHTDLFHPKVPDEWLARIHAVMALAPRHRYLLLTKRPTRMSRYYRRVNGWTEILRASAEVMHVAPRRPVEFVDDSLTSLARRLWLGVSAENQDTLQKRIPPLLETPACVRWLSAEPLLGPLALTDIDYLPVSTSLNGRWAGVPRGSIDVLAGAFTPGLAADAWAAAFEPPALDWVVAGGESGPGHRPIDAGWVRTIRDDCRFAEVPFFFKQWGGRVAKAGGRLLDGVEHDAMPEVA